MAAAFNFTVSDDSFPLSATPQAASENTSTTAIPRAVSFFAIIALRMSVLEFFFSDLLLSILIPLSKIPSSYLHACGSILPHESSSPRRIICLSQDLRPQIQLFRFDCPSYSALTIVPRNTGMPV